MRNNANIELIGYVYGEPEHPMQDKYPNWVKFTMSVTKKWKNKAGEEQKDIAWYKCSSWSEGLSKLVKNNVKAGMGLLIKGAPKASAYIDKEGQPKAQIEIGITELFMLTFPQEGWNSGNQTNDSNKSSVDHPVSEITDDEIPF